MYAVIHPLFVNEYSAVIHYPYMNLSQLNTRLTTSPKMVISVSLLLVLSSVVLLSKNYEMTNNTRHYAVSTSTTLRSTDALREGTNSRASVLFKQVKDRSLVGVSVVESASEFLSPTVTNLTLTNPDGVTTTVTTKPVEYSTLSSDGTKTLYITGDKKTYLYDNTTKSETLITDRAAFLPDLCSDNTHIVYKELPSNWSPGSDYSNSRGLIKKNIQTGQEIQLTSYDPNLQPTDSDYSFIGENSYAPTFSPDCSTIIYFKGSTTGNIGGMFIMNSDGTNQTRLTNHNQKTFTAQSTPSISDSPLWSPDGTQFIYESGGKVMKADIDINQKSLRSPVQKVADGISPSWSEDSSGKSVLEVGQRGQSVDMRSRVEVN
jgi:hypothetical protein